MTPAARTRFVLALACLAGGFVGAACASSGTGWDKDREAREAARAARPTVVQQAKYEDDSSPDGSSEMSISGEEGTLNGADVNSAIRDHFGEIRECFHIGHHAARPSGRLLLRLFVDGKGEVQDAAVLESSIGNQKIERCIADICLGVMFEHPAGNRPTTIDYPVEFRPALTAARQRRP
jgi:hypothetical protein